MNTEPWTCESPPLDPSGSHAGWAPPADLLELAAEQPELISELVADFRHDTAGRLQEIDSALVRGDRARLRAEAHSIKGSARQLGAEKLADLCQQMELATVQGPPAELAGRANHLAAEFETVWRAMTGYLAGS